VVDGERLDAVLPALHAVAGIELVHGERIRQATEEGPQLREEILRARRPVHRDAGLAASAQSERLQHPRQAEEVVGVQMREEDLLEVRQPDDRALQLPLRPLRAVEQQLLAAAAHEEGCRRALRGRHGGRGTEKEKVEVHAARL
jgi:hypothetical protein